MENKTITMAVFTFAAMLMSISFGNSFAQNKLSLIS